MIGRLFTWHVPDHLPEPDQISPITKRAIAYRHAWQMELGIAARRALSPHGKAWRTRGLGL